MTEEQIRNNLARNLIELREKSKMKKTDVADAINVTIPTISRYESGERIPDSLTLYCFSKLFGVSMEYLLEHNSSSYVIPAPDENSYNSNMDTLCSAINQYVNSDYAQLAEELTSVVKNHAMILKNTINLEKDIRKRY